MHIQPVIYNSIEPSTPLPIKEKVEIFRPTESHLTEWQKEPTLLCSVSDEYTTFDKTTASPELPLSLLKEINWDGERLAIVDNEWQIIPGEATSSLEIEEIAHEKFSSSLSIKDKVELFQSISALFEKRDDSWQKEPTLPCTVSDAHATLTIDVPLSAIASWHYFQQLYSGGYAEEQRDHLSVELPLGYTIPAFEALLTPIDVQAKGLSFEDFLALCALASFLGSNMSFTNFEIFDMPSLENIALLLQFDISPTFAPYQKTVSTIISTYICYSVDLKQALNDLKELEGFKEFAETFPIDLDLRVRQQINGADLSMIGSLFTNTITLKICSHLITSLPKEFANLIYFVSHYSQNLTDIRVLDGSKYLRTLTLIGTPVILLPVNCHVLTEVEITESPIKNLDALNGSKSLQILRLHQTAVEALPSDCLFLREVAIIHTPITNLTRLNGSKHLTTLKLIGTDITTIPTNCPYLTKVETAYSRIEN